MRNNSILAICVAVFHLALIMANTYTQLAIHVVFAVRNREALISLDWDGLLYAYMVGVLEKMGHRSLIINGVPDHVHILLEFNPNRSLSDTVRELKKASTGWLNERKLAPGHFQWQTGYSAFSVSKRHVKRVIAYINNQKQHHIDLPFMAEYKAMLEMAGIEYNEKYLFDSLDLNP